MMKFVITLKTNKLSQLLAQPQSIQCDNIQVIGIYIIQPRLSDFAERRRLHRTSPILHLMMHG